MTWQFLLVIYLLLNTTAYLLQRKLGQTLAGHKRLVSAFFFLAIHYPLGLIVAFNSSPNLHIGWLNALFLFIGSWVFPIIIVLSLKASKTVDAGLFTITSNLIPVITILAAMLLLHESLNSHQILGTVIIIASAFIITLPYLQHHRKSRAAGLAAAFLCFLLGGLATVYERWMLTRIGFGSYLIYGWGFQTLWTVIIAWPERKSIRILFRKKYFISVMGYALSASIKGVLFIAALSLTSASLVTAFISFTAIMVVLAAYFVLKEKEWLWLKISAAVLGSIGLIILNINT